MRPIPLTPTAPTLNRRTFSKAVLAFALLALSVTVLAQEQAGAGAAREFKLSGTA